MAWLVDAGTCTGSLLRRAEELDRCIHKLNENDDDAMI